MQAKPSSDKLGPKWPQSLNPKETETMRQISRNIVAAIGFLLCACGPIDPGLDDTTQADQTIESYAYGEKYAVIINGSWEIENRNYTAFYDDIRDTFLTLTNAEYNFKKENIWVLAVNGPNRSGIISYWQGTQEVGRHADLDGDGLWDVRVMETSSDNIYAILEEISAKIHSNDMLFFFFTDHGGIGNPPSIDGGAVELWGRPNVLTTIDLLLTYDMLFQNLPPPQIISMINACKSGSWVLGNVTLNGINRLSMSNAVWNQDGSARGLVIPWTRAMQKSVNADYNADGAISYYEAFQYALEYKQQNSRPEDPQYASDLSPGFELGKRYGLNGRIPNLGLVYNGSFDFGTNLWNRTISGFAWSVASGQLKIDITQYYSDPKSIRIMQSGLQLDQGKSYRVSYRARAQSYRTINVSIETSSGTIAENTVWLYPWMRTYSFDFTVSSSLSSDPDLHFNLGGNINDVWLDNISITAR